LNGNQSFLVAKKGGMANVFENLSTKAFQKHDDSPFVASKIFWLPSKT